jgi:hypothetical protein
MSGAVDIVDSLAGLTVSSNTKRYVVDSISRDKATSSYIEK